VDEGFPDDNGDGVPDCLETCEGATDCDDGLFCNGEETCLAGDCYTTRGPRLPFS